jgi:arginyl-tRNA synthetase
VDAVRDAVADGELSGPVPDHISVTWEDGRYVSPLPLRLAAATGREPREVAKIIASRVENAEVTGPGFLAVAVADPGVLARHIVEAGDYGHVRLPAEDTTWPDRPRTFDNPGFVVRFAYARAASVRRHAHDLGLVRTEPLGLDDPYELRLLGLLADLPGRADQAVREKNATPYRRQLVEIAEAYHDVYERCPALPKGDERVDHTHTARLTLAEAVRIALNNGLRALGESPEERL